MSLKKKVVWLPYDFDTSLGINNEGALVFDYALEDTDVTVSGKGVYNDDLESVLWNNIRMAFPNELAEMYKTLRSTGALSYEKVEQMFEDHQSKWPENIFNEDAWFKYIIPLIENGADYLNMLQGSKAEQRKWWLYNRFRYIDSKYNAGDALSDFITLRAYTRGVAEINITPYADIYPTIKYGSYLVSERGKRNVATTIEMPSDLSTLNDTEIYIYSASQIADIGDVSSMQIGLCDVSMAVNLQSLKIGDSDPNFVNTNMYALSLGNNRLLKTLDVRNCSGLGTTSHQGHTQTTVDLSGCSIIEEIYLDGTSIAGVTLPNGGVIKKLHLPGTITNLTILNQNAITELVVPSYSGITTLRLENVPTIDVRSILNSISASARVRLIGFSWEVTGASEIESILAKLDTMRGLDENGNNMDKAQVFGLIHTSSLTGAQIASYRARYPDISFSADHLSCVLRYYVGSSLQYEETVLDGGNGTWTGTPSKASDAQYTYTFAGWSKTDDNTVDDDARTAIVADRNVYACYTGTLQKYTVTFVRASADGGGTLQTISDVNYGTVITAASAYTGSTPTTTQGDATDYPFEGWNPASATVQGNTTFTAKFGSPIEVKEITDSWDTIIQKIDSGAYKTDYKVGNYKPLDLGTEGIINMQIVAMDADELANGSGYAPLTFVARNYLLATKYAMNDQSVSIPSWANSRLRVLTFPNVIEPLIPSNVRARIQEVIKFQSAVQYSSGTKVQYQQQTIDKLWIPSRREAFGTTGEEEHDGVIYSTVFKDDYSRIRMLYNGNLNSWHERSSMDASRYRKVTDVGRGGANDSLIITDGICLGFCLGLEPETITDSWETILANENPSETYSIGDTKYVDLGARGKTLMEIVAFDADDKADGSGKAKITWISKDVITTEGNGYIYGDKVRQYLQLELPKIESIIQSDVLSSIVPVTKSTSTSGTQSEDTMTVWAPSFREIRGIEYPVNWETTGPIYGERFPDNSSRMKHLAESPIGAMAYWAARTNLNGVVDPSGATAKGNGATRAYIAFGFCTD